MPCLEVLEVGDPQLVVAIRFARDHDLLGRLITETMLVAGVNTEAEGLAETADWIATLGPEVAYLAFPVRPAAEAWVAPPGEDALLRAYEIFAARIARVECLGGADQMDFGYTGDAAADLLATTSVHPMSQAEVEAFLKKAGATWTVVVTG